mmetsp:Transcript_84742/g.234976  ORF Transcript_84742/g.234976 Transcript_84742/m.234976 type:complete len:128 (-) Transcript_84742:1713-2096(-)
MMPAPPLPAFSPTATLGGALCLLTLQRRWRVEAQLVGHLGLASPCSSAVPPSTTRTSASAHRGIISTCSPPLPLAHSPHSSGSRRLSTGHGGCRVGREVACIGTATATGKDTVGIANYTSSPTLGTT